MLNTIITLNWIELLKEDALTIHWTGLLYCSLSHWNNHFNCRKVDFYSLNIFILWTILFFELLSYSTLLMLWLWQTHNLPLNIQLLTFLLLNDYHFILFYFSSYYTIISITSPLSPHHWQMVLVSASFHSLWLTSEFHYRC